jgi:nucleotide-binding universal stress UspA family protein
LFEDQVSIISYEIAETKEMVQKLEDLAERQFNKVINSQDSDKIKIITATKREVSTAPDVMDYASDNNIDLIVMGTHGRRGLEHLLLGSVTEKVVRMAHCPMFTAKAFGRSLI